MTDDYRKPSDIEADIASERARLSRDLSLLNDRLTVEGLMDEVKLQVRAQIDDVTTQLRGQVGAVSRDVSLVLRDQIGAVSESVSRTARKNPWPIAVVGVGLAWLAISAMSPDRPARKKPRIGMAPVKPDTQPSARHYDNSPADMAAAQLEDDADTWAEATLARHAQPIPPYDPGPAWSQDDEDTAPRRR